MNLSDSLKTLFIETAPTLKGHARRRLMAPAVKELGPGGQRRAERERGWNRATIRKGMHEVQSGLVCLDNFTARGRKRAEDHLPNLLTDSTAMVDRQSQTDPQFRTKRLYTRIERCWGLLENHGDGSILDTVEAVVQFTARMTWPGLHPVVELITAVYETGVTLTKAGRDLVEAQITRLPGLGKWFIDIAPPALRVG